MKKILSVLIVFLLLGFINVDAAACKANEKTKLDEAANKVKIGYDEVMTKKTITRNSLDLEGQPFEGAYEVTEESLKITVYGISNDIFIIMTSDENDEEVVINNENSTDGKYSFVNENITDLVNYKFDIYSNVESCDTTLLKTVNFTKPFLNPNARYEACVDNQNVPFCQKYITKLFNIPEEELVDSITKYLNGELEVEDPTEEGKNNKKNNYLIYGAIGGSTLIVFAIAYIMISKRRGAL